MFDLEIDAKRFEILKEQYLRGLKNFKAEQPYQQAVYYLALILTEAACSKEELIDAMKCKFSNKSQRKFFNIVNFSGNCGPLENLCSRTIVQNTR